MGSIEPRDGGAHMILDEDEARILRDLLTEMKQLLDQEHAIQDEVIDRLFPAAFADPADAEGFRELVGKELKSDKQRAIADVLDVLGEAGPLDAIVPRSEVDTWLTAMNDVRLALGTRFAVDEEKMAAELDPSDRDSAGLAVLHWMGWMQEMLIRAITEREDDGRTQTR